MNKELSEARFLRSTKNLNSPRLLQLRSWKIVSLEYPVVDVMFVAPGRRPLRLRLTCLSWDDQAPSIDLMNEDGAYLTQSPTGSGVFHQGPHPDTNRPFICSPGSLQYHTHPSHLNDPWENYRNNPSFDLGGIVTQIWNAWKKTSDPHVL